MFQTHETEIDGVRYRVRELGAGEALAVATRAFKLFGPAVAQAMAGIDLKKNGSLSMGDLPLNAIRDAVLEVAERIAPTDLDYFVRTFAAVTEYSVDNEKWPLLRNDTEGAHFAGKIGRMFKWLIFCARVNYSDFFTGIDRVAGAVRAASQAKAPSSSESRPE